MAKKVRIPESTSDWMNTYADLVTLLLCFFVLLYSMSAIDAEKWQRFANAFKSTGQDTNQIVFPDSDGDGLSPPSGDNAPPNAEEVISPPDIENTMPQDFNELYHYLVQYTQQNNMQDSVQLFQGEDTVYIRFNNNIFFYPDKATLRPESFPILEFLGDCLYNVQEQIFLININGHTASVEYSDGYPVSAWTLSGERATNIAIYFEDEKDIDPKKLRPIGYANNYPVAPNDTEENRMSNRRVDMVIVSNDADAAQRDSLYSEFAGLFDPSSFPQHGGAGDLLTPDTTLSTASPDDSGG